MKEILEFGNALGLNAASILILGAVVVVWRRYTALLDKYREDLAEERLRTLKILTNIEAHIADRIQQQNRHEATLERLERLIIKGQVDADAAAQK